MMLVVLSAAVQLEGVPEAARVTVPVKPATGATVMMEVDEAPALKLMAVGLAVTA